MFCSDGHIFLKHTLKILILYSDLTEFLILRTFFKILSINDLSVKMFIYLSISFMALKRI